MTEPEAPAGAAPDHPNLTAALAAAQTEFPSIAKSQKATIRPKGGGAEYSYTYADLGDVLAAVRPVLGRHGLAITQPTRRLDGKVILETRLAHVSGESEISEIEIGQPAGNPQQFGGALTYLRRYEACTLLGIAAEEDRDAQHVDPPARTNGNGQPRPPWAEPASRDRTAELGEALVPLVGESRARDVVASVRASIGWLPDIVVATAKLIAAQQTAALEEIGYLENTKREIAATDRDREKAAAAKAAADQAQDAAEGPDQPAPDPQPDPAPSDEDLEGRRGVFEPEPEQTAGPAIGSVPRPTDEQVKAKIEADYGPDALVGDTTSIEEEMYRDAGCICTNPLADDDDQEAHDGMCPIVGHGIPF